MRIYWLDREEKTEALRVRCYVTFESSAALQTENGQIRECAKAVTMNLEHEGSWGLTSWWLGDP